MLGEVSNGAPVEIRVRLERASEEISTDLSRSIIGHHAPVTTAAMVQTGGVKAEGGQQEILLPPPLKDIQFYGSLTPDTAQPYLAISGIGDCKGYWIGALPVPPRSPRRATRKTTPRRLRCIRPRRSW